MEEYETRAFAELFERDVATLYVAGLLEAEDLLQYAEDKVLMRVVETCAASASMPQTTLLLARNLYAKWSNLVAEAAVYDRVLHDRQTVKLQAPYLR